MTLLTHHLDDATEEQKQEYYMAVCERLQIPADQNLLAFVWLDSRDDGRHLVLYAKKGATDLLRSQRGISVKNLTMSSGPGFVSFIAEGVDSEGRTEMAAGSATIEGLKGKALETAVMVASTRAIRRMTLQFVGGGLLDESEVNQTTTDISRAPGPLSAIAPILPAAPPNNAPGKDITNGNIAPEVLQAGMDLTKNLVKSLQPLRDAAAGVTQAQQEAQDALKASLPKLTPDSFENASSSLQTAQDANSEPPVRRKGRRPKSKIDLGPGVSPNVDKLGSQQAPIFDAGGPPNVKADIKADTAPVPPAQNPPIQGVSLQTSVDIKAVIPAPTTLPATVPGVVKTRTQRLLEAGNALADANLKPVEGIGGPGTMLRVFAGKRIGKDWNSFNVQEWTDFLDYFESQVKELGIKEMVNVVWETVAGA